MLRLLKAVLTALVAFLFLLLPLTAWAAQDPGQIFTPDFLTAIATATALVLGLTEMLKRMFRYSGALSYVISFFLSVVATLPSLQYGAIYWATLTVFVWLNANGIYKIVKG